jgi:magnesium-transporting ATPase (P-type)
MLTGDNPFTAVNIGHSCGLIEKKQKTFIINETDPNLILKQLKKIKRFIYKKFNTSLIYDANHEKNKSTRGDFCIVITGDSLTIIQKYCESKGDKTDNSNDLNQTDNSKLEKE